MIINVLYTSRKAPKCDREPKEHHLDFESDNFILKWIKYIKPFLN